MPDPDFSVSDVKLFVGKLLFDSFSVYIYQSTKYNNTTKYKNLSDLFSVRLYH